MRTLAIATAALLSVVQSCGQEADSPLITACQELLIEIDGEPKNLDVTVSQEHRRVSVVYKDPMSGKSSTVVCTFRNLDDSVPELESIALNGHSPMLAASHPEWNRFIWSHFTGDKN